MTQAVSAYYTPLHSFPFLCSVSSISPAILRFASDRSHSDMCTTPDQLPLLVCAAWGWNLSYRYHPSRTGSRPFFLQCTRSCCHGSHRLGARSS